MSRANDFAHPHIVPERVIAQGLTQRITYPQEIHSGLTIREEFAKAAMTHIVGMPHLYTAPKVAAQMAVDYADALIAELSKPSNDGSAK
jgi:hypothetical protein